MARQAFLVSAFLLFLNVSLVLCRDDYQQYYSNHYSHHHHKSTPADSVPSTEAPVSIGEATDEHAVKQNEIPIFGVMNSDVKGSEKPVLQRSEESALPRTDAYTSHSISEVELVARLIIFLACAVVPVIALAVYICCRPACCGGKQTPGYIIQQSGPESPLLHTAPPTQQLPSHPPGYTFPPVERQYPPKVEQYQTSQVQQQYQQLPEQQYVNSHVAPPPYSEKY